MDERNVEHVPGLLRDPLVATKRDDVRRRGEQLVRGCGEALPPVTGERAEHVLADRREPVIDTAVRQPFGLLPDDALRDTRERRLAIAALEGVVGSADQLELDHRRHRTAPPCEDAQVETELIVVADASAAADAAAAILVEAARAGLAIALSGGSTPWVAYERAARIEPDWGSASLWLVDERCVPPDDPRANALKVRETILDLVTTHPTVHAPDTLRAPLEAAAGYDALLRNEGTPSLVFLGIGSDGHTASLFPDAPALAERERLAVATEGRLEPLVPRVTFTLPTIAAADRVVFLVTGEDKAERLRQTLRDDPTPTVPASLARSAAGRTTVLADAAAASRL